MTQHFSFGICNEYGVPDYFGKYTQLHPAKSVSYRNQNLTVYATSAFSAHSLVSTVLVVQSIVNGR